MSTSQIGGWVIEEPLGAGSMGRVYRCHHGDRADLRVAIKVSSNTDGDGMLLREASALTRVDHPALVHLVGIGRDEQGRILLAMELVDGETLSARLRRGAMSVAEAMRLVRQAAEALHHAHQHGVCHQDLKPANLMLRSDGSLCILDLGAAWMRDDAWGTDGGIYGTVAYMPPELLQGHTPDPVQSDVYALGVVLYETLTGRRAFRGEGSQRDQDVIIRKIAAGALDPGAKVPVALRALIRAATSPDPAERLADMAAFIDALEAAEQPQAAVGGLGMLVLGGAMVAASAAGAAVSLAAITLSCLV